MLTGILFFVLLLVLLCAIPLTVSFNLIWSQGFSGHLTLGWPNGFAKTTIPLKPNASPDEAKSNKRKWRNKTSTEKGLNGGELLRNKPFRKRIVRYIRDIWGAFDKQDVNLFMRIGLDDPADTGRLWALLGPLSAVLATHHQSQVALQPDFLEQTFELESSGTIRIIPLQLIYLTASLLISPTIWSGIMRARRL